MTAAKEHGQSPWKDKPPPERAWKRRTGTSPTDEQNRAAGGRHRRTVDLGDGRYACASVSLRVWAKTRRIRAFLRWSDNGDSPEISLGEVEHGTRRANLAEAWDRAWERGLLVEEPAPSGSWASSAATRSVMRGNRGRDTKPELRIRSLLHARGLRYHVDVRPLAELPRRADIVFPRDRVAVFVDGCFWHGCPEHHRASTKNPGFWTDKVRGNRLRDEDTNHQLMSAGWRVIRVWEHEEVATAADRIEAEVRARRSAM